jgi:hypothetical protein
VASEDGFITIVATYINRTADTVYIAPYDATPNRWGLERWANGRWAVVYRIASALDPSPPTRVPTQTTNTDTIRILVRNLVGEIGTRAPHLANQSLTGTYRLRYTIYSGWKDWWNMRGTRLPEMGSVSNTFTINVGRMPEAN